MSTRMSTRMNRRALLTTATLGAGALALSACGEAGTQVTPPARTARAKRKLRMVTTWPENFPGLGASANRLAERIREATGGAIDITVYAAGEIVPAFEAFDAVASGAADIYHGAEYYWQGKAQAYNFFTGIPFGMTAPENFSWIYHGEGQALWDRLAAPFNIKPLACTNTGTQMGGWFKTPIRKLDDLQGLTIRIPGLGGEIYRRAGATPVTLPGAEIFPSLQSGKIKAAEWVGPWNDLAFGFHQLAKNCYWPGFHEPGAMLAAGFNLDVWKSLDESDHTHIRQSCMVEHLYSYAAFNHENAKAHTTLRDKHQVRFRRFPKPVLRRLKEISHEVVAEVADESPLAREIYESYSREAALLSTWMGMAERGYMNARDER